MPAMMGATFPMEILQSKGQVTIIEEAFTQIRRILLDRPQKAVDDVEPGFYGHSVGHWDGGVLIVDTVGVRENVLYQNVPHSKDMRIKERISLGANATLEATAGAPDRVRGMLIEMPVLDNALLGCALAFTPLGQMGFKTVGLLPAGLPELTWPSLRPSDVDGVIPLAFACFCCANGGVDGGSATAAPAAPMTRSATSETPSTFPPRKEPRRAHLVMPCSPQTACPA